MPLEVVFPWVDLNNETTRNVEFTDSKNHIRTFRLTVKKHQIKSSSYTTIFLEDITKVVRLRKLYREIIGVKRIYEFALESLFDGVIIADREGKIIYINKAQEKIDNVTKSEVINKHATEVFNLDNESSVIVQALLTKQNVPERHQYYINMVGQAVNIVTYGYPLRAYDVVIGSVAICRDTAKAKDFAETVLRVYNHNTENVQTGTAPVKSRGKHVNYFTFNDIIGSNAAFKEAIRWAQISAKAESNVLIYGLTGTGKELFAQSIHSYSNRKDGPFIGINCAALPESLLESILFGTVKGAFTGAIDRPGLFEQANGGTLFLDELNSMPLGLQAKLLRVIQDGMFRRVGGIDDISVNVRVLSSLNTDPMEAVEQGILRQDLFYRLAVVSIRIPILQERKDDIPTLTSFFIGKHNQKLNGFVEAVSPEVMECFLNYNWPGNVRELEHVLECAMVILGDGKYIKLEHLPRHLIECYAQQQQKDHINTDNSDNVDNLIVLDDEFRKLRYLNNEKKTNFVLKRKLDTTEKELIMKILDQTEGNVSKTARILGISRQSLQYRMKKFDITRNG